MKSDSKLVYDYENDVLFVAKNKRLYEDSFELENMVFDLDADKKIVGLEILNASKVLGVDKVFLKNVLAGEMKINVNKQSLKLQISLKSKVRNSKRSAVYKSDNFKPDFLKPLEANFAVAIN